MLLQTLLSLLAPSTSIEAIAAGLRFTMDKPFGPGSLAE